MAQFEREYLNNKLFLDQTLSFDAMGAYPDGTKAGAFPQPNGDVLIRLHISGGKEVTINVSVSNFVYADVVLTRKEGDVFEGVIPFDERMSGPANVKLYVGGAEVLSPDLPIIWTDNRPQNNIEIPDPEGGDFLVKDVPHGTLCRELLYSHSTGAWERCMIYTPPGYRKSEEALPVLYLLHGGGDNEQMWEYVGKVSHILDNLWAENRAKPFVTVMMNGMLRHGGHVKSRVDSAFQEMLLEDCIPFVEENYRVKTDKWNRAIAGLSMGAYMTCDIGFAHPELFGSIGTFTASMSRGDGQTSCCYERPYPRVLKEGAEAFRKNYKLYWRSTTPQENHLELFLRDDELLKDAGIYALPCHHRTLYGPNVSKWTSWRRGLRDFAQLLFR